jgi:hypothetical protein
MDGMRARTRPPQPTPNDIDLGRPAVNLDIRVQLPLAGSSLELDTLTATRCAG